MTAVLRLGDRVESNHSRRDVPDFVGRYAHGIPVSLGGGRLVEWHVRGTVTELRAHEVIVKDDDLPYPFSLPYHAVRKLPYQCAAPLLTTPEVRRRYNDVLVEHGLPPLSDPAA